MSETKPRREATRLRLIEAGIREYGRRGVDATSVEQLCEAAGFSRGAFYSNFSTKDEVCLAAHRHIVEHQLERFGNAAKSLPEGLDVVGTVRHVLAVRHGDPDVERFILELWLRAQRSPEFARQFADAQAGLMPKFAEVVRLATERAKVDLLVDFDDFTHILEALFVYSLPGEGDELSTRLLSIVAERLTRPKEQA